MSLELKILLESKKWINIYVENSSHFTTDVFLSSAKSIAYVQLDWKAEIKDQIFMEIDFSKHRLSENYMLSYMLMKI